MYVRLCVCLYENPYLVNYLYINILLAFRSITKFLVQYITNNLVVQIKFKIFSKRKI